MIVEEYTGGQKLVAQKLTNYSKIQRLLVETNQDDDITTQDALLFSVIAVKTCVEIIWG